MADLGIGDILERVAALDAAGLDADELTVAVIHVERLRNALEGLSVRLVGEVERRRLHEKDGSLTAGAWLAKRTALAPSTARERVRVARGLRALPAVDDALSTGRISYTHARVLVAAAAAHADAFPAAQDVLLGAAGTLPVRALQQVVDHWAHSLEPEAASERALRQRDRRWVALSQTFDGMWALNGLLDPESGQYVHNALQAVDERMRRECPETETALPAQRRADALVEAVGHASSDKQRTGEGSAIARAQVVVSCDLAMLEQRAGHRLARLEGGDLLAPEALRRLACDAEVCRLITDGPSQILDVGRMTRTVTDPIRRALVARDGGCVFPGCDRPHRWTDAHHLIHWADGGQTGVANLVLLCRRHHVLVHEGGFGVGVDPLTGQPIFTAPDGATISVPAGFAGTGRSATAA